MSEEELVVEPEPEPEPKPEPKPEPEPVEDDVAPGSKIPDYYPKTTGCELYEKLITKVNKDGLCIEFESEPTISDFTETIGEKIQKVGDCIFNSRDNFPIKFKKNGKPYAKPKSVIDSLDYDRNLIAYVGVNQDRWIENTSESIYLITINGHIIKIGETTCSLKERFQSYLCGDRAAMKKGSCSTTNFIVNEVCYSALLLNHTVEIYAIRVPKERVEVVRFGVTKIITYSAVRGIEEMLTDIFENKYSHIPILCSQKGSNNSN